jgi:hypothetical protein
MTACGKFVSGYNAPDRNHPDQDHWVELRTAYPCSVELEASGAHQGPCAAVEQPQTVSARGRWLEAESRRLKDLRHTQSGLGESQGRPLTFAENAGADPAITHPSQEVLCPLCSEPVLSKDLPDHLRQVHASVASTAIHAALVTPGAIQEALDEGREERTPTRKDRKHDQALPEANEREVMHEVLIDLVNKRLAVGVERYGTGLQPMNGRDAWRDLVEELVDATVYTLQIAHERAEMFAHAREIYEFFESLEEVRIPKEIRESIDALVNWLETPVIQE